ncbi:MAG TPA: cytochrome c maturation protein CcmE [Gaiellaceae bacterium]|nr:cytochrome c maturation protein CcmE [Gaiellaceae bacterium]
MRASPARLVIALSVAAALAVFIVYTAVAGAGTPQLEPSALAGHPGDVELVGQVVGPLRGDAHTSGGLRFRLEDITDKAPQRVSVNYHGDVPDLFKVGRHVVVEGTMRNGVFVANRNSLTTKCPSKYAPAKTSTTG